METKNKGNTTPPLFAVTGQTLRESLDDAIESLTLLSAVSAHGNRIRHQIARGRARFMGVVAVLTLCASASVAGQPAEDEFPNVLEEVIVQAQKRSQVSQQVPVAVTALSSAFIEESQMLTLTQLTELHPSVSFDVAQNFQNASLKIRGIGTVGNARNFEGSVGIFVDGVYRTRSAMMLSDFYDVERLEVLRGPQNTLFGKNTVAGALALYSNRPEPGVREGKLELRLGDYDSAFLAGAWNAPLGETGAIRFSGTYHRRDAFFTSPDNGDDYDAIDRYSARAMVQFDPADDLELLLIADFAESDAECCWGSPLIVNGPTTPLIQTYAALNGLTFVPAPDSEDQRSASLNTLPREKTTDYGLNVQVIKDFDSGSLKSITAVRRWENTQTDTDPDWGPADLLQFGEPVEIDFFSQEFNFITNVGDSDLLLGMFFSKEDYQSDRDVRGGSDTDDYLNFIISSGAGAVACLPPLVTLDCLFPAGIGALIPEGTFSGEVYDESARSWAVFGHWLVPVTDRVNLVLGLRYSEEKKTGGVDNYYWYDSAIVRAVLASVGVPDDGTPRNGFDLIGTPYSPSFRAQTDDEELTGTLAIQYYFNDDTMLYGRYDRGYKASGINLFREAIITDTTTYDPEHADSFELGLKMDYLGGRARTNFALFYSKFTDMQINFFENLTFRTENTAESSTKGLEIEGRWLLSDALKLELGLTFLDAKFDRIDTESLLYLEGRETPRAPDLAGLLALTWERPVTDRLDLYVRGQASYTGEHYVSPDIPDERKADAYTLVDLSLGIRNHAADWELRLWCSNCGDESYRTILINTPFQPGSVNAYLGAPRQYGVTFRKSF